MLHKPNSSVSCLLSGAELSLPVDLNTTPLCRVPDAHVYVAEYLCTDEEERGFPADGGNTTSRPTLESGSPSLGVSFATTTPMWTRPTTRDPMEGVPPNRCTWVSLARGCCADRMSAPGKAVVNIIVLSFFMQKEYIFASDLSSQVTALLGHPLPMMCLISAT